MSVRLSRNPLYTYKLYGNCTHVLCLSYIFAKFPPSENKYMYIYNERLIQEFHMILTVAATSMYLILKSVGLTVVHILFISKF